MKKKQICASLLAASIAAGCSSAPAANRSEQNSISAQNTSAAHVEAVALSDAQKLSVFDFSWNLFKEIRQEKEDALLSPLSAFFALGMAANGAAGSTLTGMEETMGLDLATVNALSRAAIETAKGENRQLSIANSVWVKDVTLLDAYQSVLKNDYDAEGFTTDFSADAAKTINDWVSDKTDGEIGDLVTPSSIEDLSLLLIDALSFDAKWETPYEEGAVGSMIFTDADRKETECEALYSSESLYVDADSLEGFIKPYENDRYAFAALLPKASALTLDEALGQMKAKSLEEALKDPQDREVNAVLPSFEMESESPLKEALASLGMQEAFESQADFSKMTEDEALVISSVVQKAKIKVDAQGTKAAAATEIGAMGTSAMVDEEEPVQIVCDQPFLYLIIDRETGTPVFIGTLEQAPTVNQ